MKCIFSIIICLLTTCLCFANPRTEYRICSITSKQGLSNSAVLTIFQDHDGLMWFGTYDGLNCYDSKEMEVFRAQTSNSDEITFRSNIIQKVCQADNNCLWIKTFQGLARFSLIERKIMEIYSGSDYYNVYSNSDGDSWVINNSELLYYNTYQRKFISLGNVITKYDKLVNAFVSDNGEIWLMYSDSKDIQCFSVESFSSKRNQTVYKMNELHIHNTKLFLYFAQEKSFCFVDIDMNLYLYDVESNAKKFIRNISDVVKKYGKIENIVSLNEDVIIAFHLNGLVKLDYSDGYKDVLIDRTIRVFSMVKDRNREIAWVGTDGQGVLMLSRNTSIGKTIELTDLSPLLKRQVRCIATDKHGGLWVGTKGDGLIHLNDYENENYKGKCVEIYSGTSKQSLCDYIPWKYDNRVFTIMESRFYNGMWIGGTNSNLLSFYSFDSNRMIEVDGFDTGGNTVEIKGIYEKDKSTLLVLATLLGLVELKIDNSGNDIKILKQNNCRIYNSQGVPLTVFYSMVSQGDSVLWIGDRGNGLVRYNIDDKSYKNYLFQDILGRSADDILCLCQYDNNKLYIGTSTGVVSMKHSNSDISNVSYIGLEHGLSNDMVHGILADKNGFLWMSTNKGLNKYNPVSGKMHTFYGNGIHISEYSDGAYYKCPYTGRLFFGGVNGLLYISDNTSIPNSDFPNVVLREFSIENNKMQTPDYEADSMPGWKVNSDKGYFRFKFVVPDYIGGDNIEYSYMLDGFDSDWSKFDKTNEVIYSSVPNGKYVFKVRYKKDINENNGKILCVPVYVYTSWYKSFLFILFVSLTVIALLVILLRYHLFKKMSSLCVVTNNTPDIINATCNVYDDIEHCGVLFKIYSEEQKVFVEKFINIIENNIDSEGLDIPFIASKFNISTRQFYRKFNDMSIEISPNEFIKICRLEKSAYLLRTTDKSIQDILVDVGMNSRSYFYKEFTKRFGLSPKDYRNSTEK